MLKIHNSLTKQKEAFQPIDPNNIRMYVCGMTVYDYCHIGHARVLVVFDVVYRFLQSMYGKDNVTYIRNITDIDDKIIRRANENNEDFSTLTERFIEEMNQDALSLGTLKPDEEPRATGHMSQIINMVETLISKGYAYAADNGDVYYSVSKFEGYGKLSGRNLADERSGARVEIDEAKVDPMDFVLWKAAKENEPYWDSPWGQGRPGWHIECSAMSTHCLGNNFDIHGGGMDLKFPHHENEIAQSEAATGEKFSNTWMHNGHVMINEEKMSKSLDNFFTVREVLKIYQPEVIRYFILNSHYRSPLNYSQENLESAKSSLERLYTSLRGFELIDVEIEEYNERFNHAMCDDFNTAEALSVLFEVSREANKHRQIEDLDKAIRLASALKNMASVLGLLQADPEQFLKGGLNGGVQNDSHLSDNDIDALIDARNAAKTNKNWAEADSIRDELKSNNIILEDGTNGTTWRR